VIAEALFRGHQSDGATNPDQIRTVIRTFRDNMVLIQT
jgi:hypothetical protein